MLYSYDLNNPLAYTGSSQPMLALKLKPSGKNPTADQAVLRLSVRGRAGAVIEIERSQDMRRWEVFERVELGPDGAAELEVANPGSRGVEFYRIREARPGYE